MGNCYGIGLWKSWRESFVDEEYFLDNCKRGTALIKGETWVLI